jgi:hypothetical protein
MGRYYEGDIEGKFWFGIQSSDDADFFGSTGFQPDWLEYYFDESHLDKIQKGLDECLQHLDSKKDILDNFFKKNNGYTQEEICKLLDTPVPQTGMPTDNMNNKSKYHYYLMWYARYELGKKILDRVTSNKFCSFRAEL